MSQRMVDTFQTWPLNHNSADHRTGELLCLTSSQIQNTGGGRPCPTVFIHLRECNSVLDLLHSGFDIWQSSSPGASSVMQDFAASFAFKLTEDSLLGQSGHKINERTNIQSPSIIPKIQCFTWSNLTGNSGSAVVRKLKSFVTWYILVVLSNCYRNSMEWPRAGQRFVIRLSLVSLEKMF